MKNPSKPTPERRWYQRITTGYVVKQDAASHWAYVGARVRGDDLRVLWDSKRNALKMPRTMAHVLALKMREEGRTSARVVRLVKVVP